MKRRLLGLVFGLLCVGALLLAWNGARWLGRGLGWLEDERLASAGQPMTILLGVLQIVGALVIVLGLRPLARTAGLLERTTKPDESIRERAHANLHAAQKRGT